MAVLTTNVSKSFHVTSTTPDKEAVARLRVVRERAIKRAFDSVVGVTLGLLAIPVGIVTALGVLVLSGRPIFYSQQRLGRGGRSINVWKFRTMTADLDTSLAQYFAENPESAIEWQEGRKLRHDPRVTGIGRFLRKTSLDELPQLWNVIRGDMSMVGPRPIVSEELPYYGTASAFYFAVKPGLTGVWQTSGRNRITYDRRVAMDSEYVQSWSPARDALILLKTVPAVIRGAGAY